MKRLARELRRKHVRVDPLALAVACSTQACLPAPPEPLVADILQSIDACIGARRRSLPRFARATLRVLAWVRWRRRVVLGTISTVLLLAVTIAAIIGADAENGFSHLFARWIVWSVWQDQRSVPGLLQPARPWPADAAHARLSAESVAHAGDFYRTTNIWLASLKFPPGEWKAIQPTGVDPLPHFIQPNGTILLRNTNAHRSGLAGVLGYDFNWAHADFEVGGVPFADVAARFKGNGTYLGSMHRLKRPFKVDLNRYVRGQKLGDIDEMNFSNLIEDRSFMSDALAYELFRDAGVPAPRTAYAWLTLTVPGKFNAQPLGLYVVIEPVGGRFAAERFGSKKAPIFKPVTYHLFDDLGSDWADYAPIYDLKTQATPEQKRRIIDFAALVSHGGNTEFAWRLPEFLDLDEFARFLAGEVFLAHYDSILSNGQNFYLYLDPRSNRFGFIPWDLDHAWGSFPFTGTIGERERASIWHPWVGENRFLERVMAVERFRLIYRAQLEDYSTRLFVPSRLAARIDELAAILRGPVAAESAFRLEKFNQAVSTNWIERGNGKDMGAGRPAHQLKRFIEARARSVRLQLDGKSKGMILHRQKD